ncbi:MAG: enoyl-CoA hydratase/isomerase family protein [Candidatus Marinimicrobia bacterium]|nr:enoyl-CoA hydratase/isomerase family protein [Candidatus Neomarinimicrobiota bacterium]
MADKLLIEYLSDGQIVRLTLNAPKANILDAKMLADLHHSLDDLANQPNVKMIQFIGSGKHFSDGLRMAEHTPQQAHDMIKSFHGLFQKLTDLSIPTAAMVSGNCLGGAMELALACNFIFADHSARFGQPEIGYGVFLPLPSLLLPLRIGTTRAEELLLTGRILDAHEAHEFGLITRIYADRTGMDSWVTKWSEKHILPKNAKALRQGVKAARIQMNYYLEQILPEVERQYLDELLATHRAN